MKWTPPERPWDTVSDAYELARPFGPFESILEIGTELPRAKCLLASGGNLETTSEPILGSGQKHLGRYDLVIALHVLEHCKRLDDAIHDLWTLTSKYLLVEVPALEVETDDQGFDDINPGHLNHFSMQALLGRMANGYVNGSVMAIEAVRNGPWPCNRVLMSAVGVSLSRKVQMAITVYVGVAARISSIVKDGDAYLGDGYSLSQLLKYHAPRLPVFDTYKAPVPADFTGRLILTPRYLPTRDEMLDMYGRERCIDPWRMQ